jgi:valyl-tRNA synthetase
MGIPFKVKLGERSEVRIAVADRATHDLLMGGELARVHRVAGVGRSTLAVAPSTAPVPQSAVGVGPGFEVRVPLAGVIDLAAETARVDKEVARVEQDLAGIERKLQNPSFVQKAPPEVVEKDRARAEELREKRGKLMAHRAMLSGSEANPARREYMETQNDQKPTQDAPAAPAAPAQENPMVESAEKAVAAVTEAAQQAASAVASRVEKVAEAVRKAVRSSRKKVARKVAKKAAPVKKAAKKVVRKAAKKVARKPARKAAKKVARKPAARKVARKPARKGRR